MIDFSIIIPVFNLDKFIEDTLTSICNNDLSKAEIILVDDGSDDQTVIVAKKYLDTIENIKYTILQQENKGVSAARNLGIENAKGKYLIFVDGDDRCDPHMINILHNAIIDNSDMLVWRFYTFQDASYYVSQKEFKSLVINGNQALKSFAFSENRIRIGSFAVKQEFLKRNNIAFTEDCAFAEDIEFMYKCLARIEYVKTLNDILYTYVKRKGSAVYTFDMRRFQAPLAVRRLYRYISENKFLCMDKELDDYLKNGFFLLHSIFAFDACIPYLNGISDAWSFVDMYYKNYAEVEEILAKIPKKNLKLSNVYSMKKWKLLLFSRKWYVYINVMKKKVICKGKL